MCGLPFSGKTTLAKELEKQLLFDRVDIDEIKAEHGFGDKSDDKISHEDWVKIFEDMDNRLIFLMKQKKGIISDISNLEKSDRNHLRELAAKFNYPTYVIYLNTPAKIARQRWLENQETKKRFDLTEKVFYEAVESLEEPTEDENVIVLDYKQSVDDWVKTLSSH